MDHSSRCPASTPSLWTLLQPSGISKSASGCMVAVVAAGQDTAGLASKIPSRQGQVSAGVPDNVPDASVLS